MQAHRPHTSPCCSAHRANAHIHRVQRCLARAAAAAPTAEHRLDSTGLADWIVANGGAVSGVELVHTHYGNGSCSRELLAAQDLMPGQHLLVVPRACQVRYADCTDQRLLALFDGVPTASDTGANAWQFKQALQLLHHRLQGNASPLHTYIQQLPGIAPGIPAPSVAMLWSEQELAELQYAPLVQDAQSQAYWWRQYSEGTLGKVVGSQSDPFGGQRVTEEMLGWALSMGMSRSFGFTRRGQGHGMVPLVDMANHSFTSNAEIRSDEDGTVNMIANKQVQAGEPIQLKYGSHDNHNLLLSYGFVVPDNVNDRYTFQLDLDFVLAAISQFVGAAASAGRPLDGLRQWQRTTLRELGLDVPAGAAGAAAAAAAAGAAELPLVHIGGSAEGAPVDGKLLAACRVMLCEDRKAVKALSLEQLSSWDDTPLGRQQEAVVCKALVGLYTVLYKGFPTSIQQDKALLAAGGTQSTGAVQQPLSERQRLAVQFRLGQKQLLERAAKALLQRMQQLA